MEGTVAGVLEQNQQRPYDVILAADCLFFEVSIHLLGLGGQLP